MAAKYFGGASLPAVSAELLNALEHAFPIPIVEPGMDRDMVLFQAGARAVIDHMRQHGASGRIVTGNLALTEVSPSGARIKLGE